MRIEPKTTFAEVLATSIVGICVLLPACALAEQAPNDDWQWRATIYGYLPTISGSTVFPGAGSSIDVNANQIISNLKMTFMGALEAQKGSWGAFTDVLYLDVGGSKSSTRDLAIAGQPLPGGITANASLDVKGLIWTLAGNYRALATPQANIDVFAGARLLDLKETLGWAFSADVGSFVGPARQGSSETKLDNWDGIVGIKGQVRFGAEHKWFLPYYVDVGAGNSQLTWQAILGAGYSFSWGEVIVAWRSLDYDFSSAPIKSLRLSGPAFGAAFRW